MADKDLKEQLIDTIKSLYEKKEKLKQQIQEVNDELEGYKEIVLTGCFTEIEKAVKYRDLSPKDYVLVQLDSVPISNDTMEIEYYSSTEWMLWHKQVFENLENNTTDRVHDRIEIDNDSETVYLKSTPLNNIIHSPDQLPAWMAYYCRNPKENI